MRERKAGQAKKTSGSEGGEKIKRNELHRFAVIRKRWLLLRRRLTEESDFTYDVAYTPVGCDLQAMVSVAGHVNPTSFGCVGCVKIY
jgi:hypothetical protein